MKRYNTMEIIKGLLIEVLCFQCFRRDVLLNATF